MRGCLVLFAEPWTRIPFASPGTSRCLLSRIVRRFNSTQLDDLAVCSSNVETELMALPVRVSLSGAYLHPFPAAQNVCDQGGVGRDLEPSANCFLAAKAMFKKLWDHCLASGETQARTLKGELQKNEKLIDQLLTRIVETDVPSVIKVYEERIRKLEGEKALLAEKGANVGRPLRSFDETLRTALDFLSSPWNLWASPRFEDKRTVLKLAFSDRLAYVRNEGFRTPNLALPFKALAGF